MDARTRHDVNLRVPVNRQRVCHDVYNGSGLQVISGAGIVFLHTVDREYAEMVAYLSPNQARKAAAALMRAAEAMETDLAIHWS